MYTGLRNTVGIRFLSFSVCHLILFPVSDSNRVKSYSLINYLEGTSDATAVNVAWVMAVGLQ
jgi:hypothetical protein